MVKRVFTDRDLLAGSCNALTFALQAFNLAQLRDDLFSRVPCYFHVKSLSASSKEAIETLYSKLDQLDGVMPPGCAGDDTVGTGSAGFGCG